MERRIKWKVRFEVSSDVKKKKVKVNFNLAMLGTYIPHLPKTHHLEPRAPGTLWQLGPGSSGTKGRRSSVAGADVGPICPFSQVSPRAGTCAGGKFRFSVTVVVVAGPS